MLDLLSLQMHLLFHSGHIHLVTHLMSLVPLYHDLSLGHILLLCLYIGLLQMKLLLVRLVSLLLYYQLADIRYLWLHLL